MTTLSSAARRAPAGPLPIAAGVSLAASTFWLALGTESIARPGAFGYRDALMLAPWTLSLASLGLLRTVLGESLNTTAKRGFAISIGAMTVAAVGQIGFLVDATPLTLFAAVGVAAWILGMATIGVGLWRTGAAPRWLAAALGLTQPLTMALGVALSPWVPLENNGSYSGALVHGFTWLALGVYLLRRK
ncbi:MAG: hypothetical protein IH609_02785 [Dehalococcoidia bacterium]|nr:hypothetical protein [Dehalococcoidia bacterium]